jgi:nitrite reductase (cytochrome c-552)
MLVKAQDYQRRAQWYLDFVEADNSMGAHAPQEAARLLAESINNSRLGQVAIRDGKSPAKEDGARGGGSNPQPSAY